MAIFLPSRPFDVTEIVIFNLHGVATSCYLLLQYLSLAQLHIPVCMLLSIIVTIHYSRVICTSMLLYVLETIAELCRYVCYFLFLGQ